MFNIVEHTPAKIRMEIDGMTWDQVREMVEAQFGALMWDRGVAYPTDKIVIHMTFGEPAGDVVKRSIAKEAAHA